MESDQGSRDRAAAELASLQTDRTAVADRARQPWWYDPALGLVCAAFYASYSFGFPWVPLIALVPFLVALRLLMAAYTRHTGFWVNGLREGSTRRVVRVWFVVAAVALVAGFVAELGLGWRYSMVVVGVLLGVTITLVSRWWTTVYQRELRGQQ